MNKPTIDEEEETRSYLGTWEWNPPTSARVSERDLAEFKKLNDHWGTLLCRLSTFSPEIRQRALQEIHKAINGWQQTTTSEELEELRAAGYVEG